MGLMHSALFMAAHSRISGILLIPRTAPGNFFKPSVFRNPHDSCHVFSNDCLFHPGQFERVSLT